MVELTIKKEQLIKIDENTFELPQSLQEGMLVPGRVFINDTMLGDVLADRALSQLLNVATLPGIKNFAFAMPDVHQGYGFPIGGVAALAIEEGGVISPGGIGYDINCGVRVMVAPIDFKEIMPFIKKLARRLFHAVPSGVGQGGHLKLSKEELDPILLTGAHRMVELGYGTELDLENCEERGALASADAALITPEAKNRGRDQLGTLGSGNHFLEIQQVDEIYDEAIAQAYGLQKGFVTIMIHCGSRGLGHQTCTDYVRLMMQQLPKWGYQLPDRELVCAPFKSEIGQNYFHAMGAAANFAWANRHLIGHWTREVWREFLGDDIPLNLLYDVSHNIGKVETHPINGKDSSLIMHRKGATRAFAPGRVEIPAAYRSAGQPVLIPGTMGTASYILAGTQEGMNVAFGSCCHGAGRRLSRAQAKKIVRGTTLRAQLESKGIIVCSNSDIGLAEEAPCAYKDVDEVVRVVAGAQLARAVARLTPLAVIKGD